MSTRWEAVLACGLALLCACGSTWGTAPDGPRTPAACTWCPLPSSQDCTLCVAYNPVLAIGADGTGTGVLRVCNGTTQPVTPALHITDFAWVGPGERSLPAAAQVRLGAASTADEPAFRGAKALDPAACLGITVEVSKLWAAGPLTASLWHGTEKVVDLKAVRHPMPFRVRIDGPTPERLELAFIKGQHLAPANEQPKITLRNEDPVMYRVSWRLELDGSEVASGVSRIPAAQSVALPVALGERYFSRLDSGFLRSGQMQGRLVLQHEPDPSFALRAAEQQVYPVTARLSHWTPVWQRIFNLLGILAVLALGIVMSLLVNYCLPVQRRRVAVKQVLADQEGRLAGLAGLVSSRRLNLLRTEKKRLRDELRASQWWSPATEEALPKVEAAVLALRHRIDLTAEAGMQLAALRDDPTIALPEAELIDSHVRSALEVAELPAPDEIQLKTARAALDAATKVRLASDEPPKPEAMAALQARTAALAARQPPDGVQWQPFADLLRGLRSEFSRVTGHAPAREDYVAVARAACKAECVLEFIELVENTAGSADISTSRMSRGEELLHALLPGPDESIGRAQEIVREVEQNIRKADVIKDLQEPGAVRLEIDPPTPVAYQLVALRVKLARPGLDAAVARKQIRCCWKVSGPGIATTIHDLVEGGWTTWHYFEPPASSIGHWWRFWRPSQAADTRAPTFAVEATLFEMRESSQALASARADVALELTKSYVSDSAKLSVGALVVTLLLVAIGLLAGAQEKIQSLDWWSALIAVLALGFGADVLKRAMMK
jgi:hypothetical protein